MYTQIRYSARNMLHWTRWEVYLFVVLSAAVTVLYDVVGWTFLHLPWTPIALIGTAVAFIVGFQNNAAYGRIWEARKIWGGIVNVSRSWGMKTRDMVSNQHCDEPVSEEELDQHRRRLVHRHVAWLTALRHAMRQPKSWETFDRQWSNREWTEVMHIPERIFGLEDDLFHYIEEDEWDWIMDKKNKAAAILYLQSGHLKRLKDQGLLWEFSFLDLELLLQEMFTLQGKSERIKNFPYPRQYASLSYHFVWLFLILLPFGIVPEFAKIGSDMMSKFPLLGDHFVWLAIPFCVAVSWVFHTMMRIGTVGENPFEGSANDVPISTISRGIEIDIRQMLGDDPDEIPKQFPEEYNIQM